VKFYNLGMWKIQSDYSGNMAPEKLVSKVNEALSLDHSFCTKINLNFLVRLWRLK